MKNSNNFSRRALLTGALAAAGSVAMPAYAARKKRILHVVTNVSHYKDPISRLACGFQN